VSKFVLDASALLALLNEEPGARMVQDVLPDALISTVNLTEVIARLSLSGMPEDKIRDALSLLGLDIMPFDGTQAFQAGILANHTHPYGLSLGDRACLALALATNSVALTADKVWQKLDVDVEIELIR